MESMGVLRDNLPSTFSRLPKYPEWRDDDMLHNEETLIRVKATLEFFQKWIHWADQCTDILRSFADHIAGLDGSDDWVGYHFDSVLSGLERYQIRFRFPTRKEEVHQWVNDWHPMEREGLLLSCVKWAFDLEQLLMDMQVLAVYGTPRTRTPDLAATMSGLTLSSDRPSCTLLPALFAAKFGRKRDPKPDKASDKTEVMDFLRMMFPGDDKGWRSLPADDAEIDLVGDLSTLVIR